MRYWRILNIDDEWFILWEDIRSSCHRINKYFATYFDFEIKYSTYWDHTPRLVSSVTQGWKELKNLSDQKLEPDIGFYDVKLVTQEDSANDLNIIMNEIISNLEIKSEEMFKEVKKIFGHNYSKSIRERGGLYLMALTRKLFPKMKIVMYSESHAALDESLPYQFSNYYTMLPSGKFLVPSSGGDESSKWSVVLSEVAKYKIMTSEVSYSELKNVIEQFMRDIQLIADDNSFSKPCNESLAKESITTLLNSKIGKDDDGWLFGAFFLFEFYEYSSGHPFDFKNLMKSIENIRSILDSVDLALLLGRFIRESHFNVLSHCSEEKAFASGRGKGRKFDLKLIQEGLVYSVVSELRAAWEGLTFYKQEDPFIKPLDELIEEVNKVTDASSLKQICEKFKVAKFAMRLRLSDIQLQINKSLEEFEFQIISMKYDRKKMRISEYSMELQGKFNGRVPEAYIPARNIIAEDDLNLFGELVKTTLSCTKDHGNSNEICVDIRFDYISFQWVILISQIDGDHFAGIGSFDFTDVSHGYSKKLSEVRGWIQVFIRSNGIERCPFHSKAFNIENTLKDYQVQYEYRISACNF